jgi:hypothetical protein
VSRSRLLGTLAALLVTAAATGAFPAARAEEPEPLPPEAQRRAAWAYAVGRLEDVEAALGAAATADDRVPLEVLRRFWRPVAGGPEAARPAGDALSDRRLRFLAAWPSAEAGEWPVAAPGEEDRHPVVDALVRDRVRREARGVEGLPEGGPLATVPDEAVRAFLPVARMAYVGPAPPAGPEPSAAPALPDPSAEVRARIGSLSRRTATVAAAAGAAFLGLSLALLWALGRRRAP